MQARSMQLMFSSFINYGWTTIYPYAKLLTFSDFDLFLIDAILSCKMVYELLVLFVYKVSKTGLELSYLNKNILLDSFILVNV